MQLLRVRRRAASCAGAVRRAAANLRVDSRHVAPPLAVAAAPLSRPREAPSSQPPSCPRPPRLPRALRPPPPRSPRTRQGRSRRPPPSRHPPFDHRFQRRDASEVEVSAGGRRFEACSRRAHLGPGFRRAALRSAPAGVGRGGTQRAAPRRSRYRPHGVHQPRACSREAREATGWAPSNTRARRCRAALSCGRLLRAAAEKMHLEQ